jgi:transposase
LLDVSKETNVRFLRAAVKHLQEQLLIEKRTVLALRAAKAIDEELCQKLSDELLVLRKRFFVGGRETTTRNGSDRRRAGRRRLPHNQPPSLAPNLAPVELETDEVVHAGDSPTCACCAGVMAPMTGGFEESCEIDVTERKYTLRRHKRQKYVCRGCNKIVAAEGPAKLTPGGLFSIQMAAQVADDKFSQHLPLNRQAEQMARLGLDVGTKTLYGLTEHLAARLADVPGMIRGEILAGPCVGIDESPVKLLADDQQGYVWSISNNVGAYYQWEPTRSGKVADEMLSGYEGIVMTDGFAGYNFLDKRPGVVLVACWAHVRRGFFEAKAKYPEASAVVDLIDELYDVEREADDFEHLAELRLGRSVAIVARLDAYLDSRRGRFLASSGFGKAVTYYDERRERLHRFLKDPHAPLDNNGAERAQRDPVMGRKNFQGFRTINGADTGMTLYTIIRTCKHLSLPAKSYMVVMATRAAKGERVVTPYQWAKELAAEGLETLAH